MTKSCGCNVIPVKHPVSGKWGAGTVLCPKHTRIAKSTLKVVK